MGRFVSFSGLFNAGRNEFYIRPVEQYAFHFQDLFIVGADKIHAVQLEQGNDKIHPVNPGICNGGLRHSRPLPEFEIVNFNVFGNRGDEQTVKSDLVETVRKKQALVPDLQFHVVGVKKFVFVFRGIFIQ